MEMKYYGAFQVLKKVLVANKYSVFISSILLVFAAFLDGLSIVALLPLLELVVGGGGESSVTKAVKPYLSDLGVDLTLEALLVGLVAVILIKAIVVTIGALQVSYVQASIVARYRASLIKGLMAARWEYFSTQATGKVTNSIVTEAQGAGRLYGMLCELLSSTFQGIVYFSTAITISYTASGAAIAAGIVMMVLLAGLVRKSRLASKHQTALQASFSSELIEALQGIKPLKAMGVSSRLEILLISKVEELKFVFARMMFFKRFMDAGQEIIRAIALSVTLYVVVGLFQNSLETLLVISLLFVRMMDVIGKFQKQWQSVAVSEVPFNEVAFRMDDAEKHKEITSGRKRVDLRSNLKIKNVSFSYKNSAVISNFSTVINANGLTCVIGPSGAGKTTLIDLIIGLLEPDTGAVLVDGVDLREVDKSYWRNRIGYVPQDVFIFHDTIFSNVSLGDPTITEMQVVEALKLADAWSFVSTLDKGVYEVLGERGGRLSGGQRQRISIARALVRNPSVLVLDEATSALDQSTEAEISSQVKKISQSITVLAITHRPALVECADNVIDLGANLLPLSSPENTGTV